MSRNKKNESGNRWFRATVGFATSTLRVPPGAVFQADPADVAGITGVVETDAPVLSPARVTGAAPVVPDDDMLVAAGVAASVPVRDLGDPQLDSEEATGASDGVRSDQT